MPQGYPVRRCTDCSCVDTSSGMGANHGKKLRMFAGIKSGTAEKYQARRQAWRDSGCAEIYAKANIGYKFFVGVPIDPGHSLTEHDQGATDTSHERQLEKLLENEAVQHGDLELLPLRDQYMDISNKLLGIFKYGYRRTNADYIIEHDDEYCMQVDVALGIVDKHEQKQDGHLLYGGNYHWRGTEYESMKGVEGLIAPYFSGWCSFLSRELIGYIVGVDWAHTVMVGQYGTTADDANTGKWVKHAQDTHGIKVDFVSHGMVTDIEKMAKRGK